MEKLDPDSISSNKVVTQYFAVPAPKGTTVTLEKVVNIKTSQDILQGLLSKRDIEKAAIRGARRAPSFEKLLNAHAAVLEKRWDDARVIVESDNGLQEKVLQHGL